MSEIRQFFLEELPLNTQILLGIMLAVVIAFYAFRHFLWHKVRRKHDNFFVLLFHHLNLPVQLAFLLTAVFIVVAYLPFDLTGYNGYRQSYSIALIGLFCWTGLRVINLFCDLILRQFNVGVRDNLQARRVHTQVTVVKRLASALLILIALSAALMVFEEIRTLGVGLIASAGVAGIILGLAAQQTIGNFFTGLQIAITQPIRIDDAVVVEGEWGWIEEINLTYVVVKIWDLRRLVLPVNYFVTKPFQNWTRNSADIIGSVMLHVDYTMPVQALRDELDHILADTALWNGETKVVQVVDTTEKSMMVRVLVSAADSPSAWDLRCLVREKLVTFMQENYPEQLPRLRAAVDVEEKSDNHRSEIP